MQKEIPTISKSTVYSTLKAFVDAGILREITIEDTKVRYEYNLKDHGHFICEECGNIFDFNIEFNNVNINGLEGFETREKDVYFKGICNKCLNIKGK
jgi:Fur family peroxide stress response transcriptional regulator